MGARDQLCGEGRWWAGILAVSCLLGFIFTLSFLCLRSVLGASVKTYLARDYVIRTWLQFLKVKHFSLWESCTRCTRSFIVSLLFLVFSVQAAQPGTQSCLSLFSALFSWDQAFATCPLLYVSGPPAHLCQGCE